MIQSVFVYSIAGLLLFFFENLLKKTDHVRIIGYVGLIITFSLLAALRWNVGVDHLSYLENYRHFQRTGSYLFEKELAFQFITQLLATNGFHFSIYFGLWGALQIGFFFYGLRRTPQLLPFLAVCVLLGPEFLNWMNGIRQTFAAIIFISGVHFILRRELFNYIIVIAIAYLFHTSVLILVLLYFLPFSRILNNRVLMLLFVLLSLIIGENYTWIKMFDQLGNGLEILGYGNINQNLESLIDEIQLRSFGPRRILLIINMVILIIYFPIFHLEKNSDYPYLSTYFKLGLIGFLLFNMLGNTHHIFIRPLIYFNLFLVPMNAYLMYYLKSKRKFAMLTFYLILVLSYLPLTLIAENGAENNYSHYQFYWDIMY